MQLDARPERRRSGPLRRGPNPPPLRPPPGDGHDSPRAVHASPAWTRHGLLLFSSCARGPLQRRRGA